MSDFNPTVDKAHSHYTPTFADRDSVAYCSICNKTVDLKSGDEIPLCCDKLMELID